MKFKVMNESKTGTYIFRGVGDNVGSSEHKYGGEFFADNPTDAGNYGDIIDVFTLNNANLYSGESSIEYCKAEQLMFDPHPYISKMSGGRYDILDDVCEDLIFNGEDPNLGLAIFQAVAKSSLEKKGYQGADWSYEDDLIWHQYQIWDTSCLKHIETLSCYDAEKKY